MMRRLSSAWPALAPLPAIALGAWIAGAAGVSPLAFAPNAAAALTGWALSLLAARGAGAPSSAARLGPWLAAVGVAATFLGPGLDGVHRWLALGPVRLHASAVLAPWLLLGFTSADRLVRERTAVAALLVQCLHVAQPDAAQATAVAVGLAPILSCRGIVRKAVGLPTLLALAGLAALTWLRLDHLPPVPHIEGILELARGQGDLLLLGALLTLGLALLPLAWPIRGGDPTDRALAVGAGFYFCGSVASTFAGSFPVPLLGAGAAPVLGWFGLAFVLRRQGRVAEVP